MFNLKLDPKDCLDIILTDIQGHVQKVRKPNSFGRQYAKALHGSKQRRVYTNKAEFDDKNMTMTITINLGEKELLEQLKMQGKKYIRLFFLKDGIPVFLGQDAIEKLEADSKKYLKK